MRLPGVGCLAACAVAALAGSVCGTAGADAGVPVCVGTGVLASEAPSTTVPVAVDPSLLGPGRSGTTVASATDAKTGLTAAAVSLGVAGCVDAEGTPGGTTLREGAWSIFGGAVRGSSLRADLVPRPADGSGWWLRIDVEDLVVAGRPVTLEPGDQVAVGNWGQLIARPQPAPAPVGASLRWWRAALELDLTHAHAGFPAGTAFLIGWAAADRAPLALAASEPAPTTTPAATPAPPPPAANPTTTTTTPPPAKPAGPTGAAPKAVTHKAPKRKHVKRVKRAPVHTAPLVGQPLTATPPLGSSARTFPVVGDVAWGDTYGAHRSDVPGGWHHGDDLFAPLGTPVVAVANGIVFAVGWNHVGGWRLWLVDAEGNQYYYAHLAGYSALARNNHHVRRGQVLGFVGNTGDAVTTWPHVHFEVHPNATLYLGYDGAVDPTRYLAAWTRLGHVTTVPPPVPLPSGAPSGEGAIKDFRALLAIRPMKAVQRLAPAGIQSKASTIRALAAGRHPVSPFGVAIAHSGGGHAPILAGLLLLAGALLALLYTARAGRAD